MSGIHTREGQHRFSAATNRKGSSPCARRIGLILELLSPFISYVKLLLKALTLRKSILAANGTADDYADLGQGAEKPSSMRKQNYQFELYR